MLFRDEVTEDICKFVQKFYDVPPNACFHDKLSFSTADSFLQLIIFAYHILYNEVFKVKKFGSAMQLIIHY